MFISTAKARKEDAKLRKEFSNSLCGSLLLCETLRYNPSKI